MHEQLLAQLGGNKFLAMTGAKDLVTDEKNNSLTMSLPKNESRANRLIITLQDDDLYTVKFFNLTTKRGSSVPVSKQKASFNNVAADQLQELFTTITGLSTSL